ncbi:YbaB/EbfC family nucleoid-associated protein [Mycobacterium sp. CPCC 205372]|uniref:YbaB/EbfC family nucleoid-associated protein n=1 Tax=Mycobacterium hippophais TaxID=3016340 RepID=A0ABT4PUE9_9MYCO|nr:YbaB/EbfC family nucleoid-associated protein [Mycobacterium hippophais]MCZ8380197.1 YbaB/EbfC family nucleoid-associated protein [Mycobacterium hippophais]
MSGLADSVVARLAEQRDLLQDLNDRCSAISVRATSRDRAVTVVVDGTGAMTALTLRPVAGRMAADTLAELIVNTAQTAAAAAFDRRRQLTEQFNRRFLAAQNRELEMWDGSSVSPA